MLQVLAGLRCLQWYSHARSMLVQVYGPRWQSNALALSRDGIRLLLHSRAVFLSYELSLIFQFLHNLGHRGEILRRVAYTSVVLSSQQLLMQNVWPVALVFRFIANLSLSPVVSQAAAIAERVGSCLCHLGVVQGKIVKLLQSSTEARHLHILQVRLRAGRRPLNLWQLLLWRRNCYSLPFEDLGWAEDILSFWAEQAVAAQACYFVQRGRQRRPSRQHLLLAEGHCLRIDDFWAGDWG